MGNAVNEEGPADYIATTPQGELFLCGLCGSLDKVRKPSINVAHISKKKAIGSAH